MATISSRQELSNQGHADTMNKLTCNPYFPSFRTIQFLRRSFEDREKKGQEIPAAEWMYVELWEAMLADEPIRFPEKLEELKEMAI